MVRWCHTRLGHEERGREKREHKDGSLETCGLYPYVGSIGYDLSHGGSVWHARSRYGVDRVCLDLDDIMSLMISRPSCSMHFLFPSPPQNTHTPPPPPPYHTNKHRLVFQCFPVLYMAQPLSSAAQNSPFRSSARLLVCPPYHLPRICF